MPIEERKKEVKKLGFKHGVAGEKNLNPHPNPMSVYHFHYEEGYATGKAQHDKQKEEKGGEDSKHATATS